MNHQAIYNTHSTVKRIEDVEGGVIAYDADGNTVTLDADAVASETTTVVNEWNLKNLRAKRDRLLAETDWEIVKHKEFGIYRLFRYLIIVLHQCVQLELRSRGKQSGRK